MGNEWAGICVLAILTEVVQCEYCMSHYGPIESHADSDTHTDSTGFFIGVGLCLASALASVIGVMLQKRAHTSNSKRPKTQRRRYVQLPLWWAGLFGVVLGALLDFTSLGYAPQTVVASLGSATLVINAILAPIFLNERLSRLEVFGTLVVTVGAIVAVASSSHTSQQYNLDVLRCLYTQTGLRVYAGLVTAFLGGCGLVYRHCERLDASHAPDYQPHWARLHPISIAALSGTIGAQSLLFAKGVSIILRSVYDGGNVGRPFEQWPTYGMIVAMIVTVVSQTHTLNIGLKKFDSVVILPIFQVFWIVMGVFGAGAYFKEFNSLSDRSYLLFPLGILIISLGITILSTRLPDSEFEEYLRGVPLAKGVTGVSAHAGEDSEESEDLTIPAPAMINPRVLSISHGVVTTSMRIHALHRPSSSVVSLSGVGSGLRERMLPDGHSSLVCPTE